MRILNYAFGGKSALALPVFVSNFVVLGLKKRRSFKLRRSILCDWQAKTELLFKAFNFCACRVKKPAVIAPSLLRCCLAAVQNRFLHRQMHFLHPALRRCLQRLYSALRRRRLLCQAC